MQIPYLNKTRKNGVNAVDSVMSCRHCNYETIQIYVTNVTRYMKNYSVELNGGQIVIK